MSPATAIIAFAPTDKDIVCSTNQKWLHYHAGNVFYRNLLRKHYLAIDAAAENPTSAEYNAMVDEILIELLEERQGRFLTPTNSKNLFCTVMSREEAAQRVYKALSSHRTKFLKRKKPLPPQPQPAVADASSTTGKRVTRRSNYLDDDGDLEEEPKEIPFLLRSEDVVCGSCERDFSAHPGNEHYRSLISDRRALLQSTKVTKQLYDKLAQEILNSVIFFREGRFLQPSENNRQVGVALSKKDARLKVLTDLHELRAEYANSMRAMATISPVDVEQEPNRKLASKKHPLTGTAPSPKKAKTQSACALGTPNHSDDSTCTTYTSLSASVDSAKLPETPSTINSVSTTPTLTSSSNAWTFNSIYDVETTPDSRKKTIHGRSKAEKQMRRWLDQHRLPQSVGDVLLDLGARTVGDIFLMVSNEPSLLRRLAPLDLVKLQNAVLNFHQE